MIANAQPLCTTQKVLLLFTKNFWFTLLHLFNITCTVYTSSEIVVHCTVHCIYLGDCIP